MAIGLFTLLLAQAAAASANPIVVQGVRDRDRQVRNFVQDLTPNDFNDQVARFETPICPVVFGLAAEQRVYVAERMRQVAKAAGVDVAKRSCDPNILVIVTADKSALLKALEKRGQDFFPEKLSSWSIHQMERDPYPVAIWQSEGMLYVDGTIAFVPTNVTGGMQRDGMAEKVAESHPLIAPLSRIRPEARPYFRSTVIVVQNDALKGLTTTQFADYVAMRTFVRADPRKLRASSPDSILKVIDAPMGTPTPLTLTTWDMSFLKSFYATSKDVYAGSQRADISWRMKRELDKAATVQQ